ncbi:MAG: flagellar hook-associated protein FlgL, partial [Vicinamibacterales bacterium]
MSMRVVYNSLYADGINNIQRAATTLTEAQRQVSSGRRSGTVSDDPLGSASAILEHAALARIDTYKGAADAAAYRLNLADSALSDIVNQLSAAQTATLSARGSAQSPAQREAAARELLAIRHALVGDINTQFQGAYIFSGAKATTPPFVESGSAISTYQGDSVQTQIDVAGGASATISFDGGQIFKGGDSQDILAALDDLLRAHVVDAATGRAQLVVATHHHRQLQAERCGDEPAHRCRHCEVVVLGVGVEGHVAGLDVG